MIPRTCNVQTNYIASYGLVPYVKRLIGLECDHLPIRLADSHKRTPLGLVRFQKAQFWEYLGHRG